MIIQGSDSCGRCVTIALSTATDEKYPQNRLPYIDKLVGLFINEEATYIAGLRAGKIDFLGFTAGISDITSVDIVDNLRRTDPDIQLFPW